MTNDKTGGESTAIAMVTLKNGDVVPSVVVRLIGLDLKSLKRDGPIPFYEFVMACRNRKYVLTDSHKILQQLSLVEGFDAAGHARIHDVIRSIVLSAVKGDGLEMHLVNPVAV